MTGCGRRWTLRKESLEDVDALHEAARIRPADVVAVTVPVARGDPSTQGRLDAREG